MKKSLSTSEPFFSNRNIKPKSSYSSLRSKWKPKTASHNCYQTSFYKPSFYNYKSPLSKSQISKNIRNNSNSLTKTFIKNKDDLLLTSNFEAQSKLEDFNQNKLNLELELEKLSHESPNKAKILNKSTSSFGKSKAYTEAMKALQNKVRSLEDDNSKLQKKFLEIEGGIQDIVDEKIRETTGFFVILENNLKEKIMMLEEEKSFLQRRLDVCEEKLAFLEQKSNLDYKDFLQEKTDLKKALSRSSEKIQHLEKQNSSLKNYPPKNIKENNIVVSPYENSLKIIQKQNEIIKQELNRAFHQKLADGEKNLQNNQEVLEIQNKLTQKADEIEQLTSQFHRFLVQNQLKILPKERNTPSVGSVKKQRLYKDFTHERNGNQTFHENFQRDNEKTAPENTIKKDHPSVKLLKEENLYSNRTLDNMINNIITVNSLSQTNSEKAAFQHQKTKSLYERGFLSNSMGKMIEPNRKIENIRLKGKEEVSLIQKDLVDLMKRYKNLTQQQRSVLFFFNFVFILNN